MGHFYWSYKTPDNSSHVYQYQKAAYVVHKMKKVKIYMKWSVIYKISNTLKMHIPHSYIKIKILSLNVILKNEEWTYSELRFETA